MTTAATSKYVSASSPATSTTVDQRPGGERADRDQRVHRRRAVARALQRGAMERRARARGRPASRARTRPTPSPRTAAAAPSRAATTGTVSTAATSKPPLEPRRTRPGRAASVLVSRCRRARAVAGGLDRADEVVDADRRIEAHRRLLGREVDRRLDAVEPVQPALDPGGARGARHPLEVEPELPSCARVIAVIASPRGYPSRV